MQVTLSGHASRVNDCQNAAMSWSTIRVLQVMNASTSKRRLTALWRHNKKIAGRLKGNPLVNSQQLEAKMRGLETFSVVSLNKLL